MGVESDKIVVQFWGVRGTFPVPGKRSTRYGGNTNCVTLSFANQEFFIFDAGSGIKALSNEIVKNHRLPLSAKIFITHPHWDHINGIPIFMPLYMKDNEVEFFGPNHNDISLEKLISDQMNGVYFPVTVKEFAAKVKYRSLGEETFYINEIQIQTLFLTHPGRCLGYRIQYKNKIFCYITDNELYLKDSDFYNQVDEDRLVHFIYKADILVIDATYMDEEYLKKVHWGHSCVSRVIEIANQAKVKTACLYHHDPDQFDEDIDLKLKQAQSILKQLRSKTRCIAPREGDKILL